MQTNIGHERIDISKASDDFWWSRRERRMICHGQGNRTPFGRKPLAKK